MHNPMSSWFMSGIFAVKSVLFNKKTTVFPKVGTEGKKTLAMI